MSSPDSGWTYYWFSLEFKQPFHFFFYRMWRPMAMLPSLIGLDNRLWSSWWLWHWRGSSGQRGYVATLTYFQVQMVCDLDTNLQAGGKEVKRLWSVLSQRISFWDDRNIIGAVHMTKEHRKYSQVCCTLDVFFCQISCRHSLCRIQYDRFLLGLKQGYGYHMWNNREHDSLPSHHVIRSE